MTESQESENSQRKLFNRIALLYDAHYGDPAAVEYRRQFFCEPLMKDLLLEGKNVLEAMCAGGQTTGYLLNRGAVVTGNDISAREMELFRKRWPTCRAWVGSFLEIPLEPESFDAVILFSGLHHLHPQAVDAVKRVHLTLKKGGYFCFVEPHAGSVVDCIRRIWYRSDKEYFSPNEHSVDLDELKRTFHDSFLFEREIFQGNIGYLFAYNSLIFRIPLRLKEAYAPVVLFMEAILSKFQTRFFSCFVAARWRKI